MSERIDSQEKVVQSDKRTDARSHIDEMIRVLVVREVGGPVHCPFPVVALVLRD